MTSKPKKVTYKDTADDNADYLVPLQCDPHQTFPHRTTSSTKVVPPGGYLSSVYLPITLLLYAGVAISQFIIGLIYIGQCTVQQFISPYMILSGIFGIAFVIVGLIIYLQMVKRSSRSSQNTRPNPMILKILIPVFVLLFLCVIGWFCAGQAIVFDVKTRVELFDPVLPEYCHPILYKAAYVLIFVDYLLLLIAIIFYGLYRVSPPKKSDKNKIKRPIRKPRK